MPARGEVLTPANPESPATSTFDGCMETGIEASKEPVWVCAASETAGTELGSGTTVLAGLQWFLPAETKETIAANAKMSGLF